MTRGRLLSAVGSSVVGKRETRLYEPEERPAHDSRGVKAGAFCSASGNAIRPRGCKKIDRGGYLAGVVSVVCHEVPMDKGNHRFWAQAALYHPSHCIPSSRIVLYRTKPDTSIE
ncbi:unnamed protein product [Sphenostylis stenocarpa]|uniref:Uncharacterized protein n=1 Tax=Sphenostylis stenocarpa TaxID=92480 RepID=A0AA86T054_9FABA|nr:unnamed protein product [Sphenostylis stenocarpa]